MNYNIRLHKAFANAPVLPLTSESRYLLISDCHRGTGGSNDNFLKNQHLYYAAVQHYYQNGYTYIELGDGDELWENRSMEQIIDIHNDIFRLLSQFYQKHRLFLLYGNHDIIKRQNRKASKMFHSYFCTDSQMQLPLFPDITFYSGIILKDMEKNRDLYLTHGHQTDFLNSNLWPFSRFLVRYFWGPAERIGFLDPTSAAKNNKKKRKTEERLADWAQKEKRILITGHTHRPMVGTPDSPYFNTGSCVHPRCITCIEIEHRCMTLVKWEIETRPDKSLYVARTPLAPTVCIDDYPA